MNRTGDEVPNADQDDDELQKHLDEVSRQWMQQLCSFIDERPKEFIKMMCEGALGIEREAENPFRRSPDSLLGGTGRYLTYIEGLAKILLNKVDGVDPVSRGDGYTPFLTMVEDYFNFSPFLRSEDVVKSFDLISIQHNFFNEYADPLASAIDTSCQFVFEGLPLYRVSDESGFERLNFSDPVFNYIYKKGEYFESGPTTHVPNWAEGLYFKDSDLAVHTAFFSGSGELLDAERNMRRNALRTALGIDSVEHASRPVEEKYRGELLSLAHAVQERFWDLNRFDAADPDTQPKQAEIIDWIKQKKPGISDVEAKAVEKVACPIKR
ncbi:TPA: hypothetical protein ACU967_002446 [Burkholderia contaminans]|uniref:Uncharacterized protein n=1 Tax=Burkholderia contaminans TaxID=488447 RepID=A0AAP4QYV3_9BURK|nr:MULTISPECIES: hypothetical protein [Burkholderia]MBD1410553.1 hypothetical protein [Burkholderia contaminans]MBM6427359.1 hypothetical protein [Burkholderia contaminans]MCA7875664.1 hypothetical protein [Burkholderia contaminans]MDN7564364.1 hypothetical protein [Burkholderia contaminans]MDN8024115.1 hypothetical protein [Burkholderia contaminans]